MAPSDKTVLVLFFTLVILIALLVFLYKKLNKEANNEYTIRQIVYKEGGVRDRVRGVALTAERHLGIQLWPQSDEDEEEMQEVQDEERDVEAGDSQQGSDGSDTDGEDEEEEDSMDRSGSTKEKDGNSSCGESSGAGEEDRLMSDKPEEKEEVANQSEEKQEKEVKEEGKAEASGGTGLLIDLKQFSGSAIWSEEGGGEGQGADVTAL